MLKSDLKSHTDSVIDNVIKNIDTLTEDVQLLSSQFNLMDNNQIELQGRCDSLEQANVKLTDDVWLLLDRLRDAEQHSRSANLEVLGIPASSGGNIFRQCYRSWHPHSKLNSRDKIFKLPTACA